MSDSNGGNPRLDRIEKLIERSERANQAAHARHDREMRQLRDHLRRWTVLGVQEARNQRKRAQSLDAAQQRMDDALTALIGTVDALVRRRDEKA